MIEISIVSIQFANLMHVFIKGNSRWEENNTANKCCILWIVYSLIMLHKEYLITLSSLFIRESPQGMWSVHMLINYTSWEGPINNVKLMAKRPWLAFDFSIKDFPSIFMTQVTAIAIYCFPACYDWLYCSTWTLQWLNTISEQDNGFSFYQVVNRLLNQ